LATATGRPRYLEIADDLRMKIANGTYPVGEPLPSTSRLMSHYDVSVTVVRAAVKELGNEQLVVGQPGKAVYVQREPVAAEPSPELAAISRQIEGLRETMDKAVASLDARLSELERSASASRSRSPKR
jgi:DNA-binding GntR family transcriptional regulator